MMKITIIYDNTAWNNDVRAHWGFACLVEAHGKHILFDTGSQGNILLSNMQRLRIDPEQVDSVFISHGHGDHTGGLHTFLRIHSVPVYLPFSCPQLPADIEVIRIKGLVQIYPDIYSTGELNRIEQSLLVRQNSKITVITGCSHPGVGKILNTASAIGTVSALVGGLHGFSEFDLLKPLNTIVPCHCTKYISTIKTLYPDKYIEGGAGRIIEIE